MSKVKSPRAKKRLSLERDRRNTYGENAKSSGKNIPRRKQRTHMKERRGVAQILADVTGVPEADDLTEIELKSKMLTSQVRHSGFKKSPDKPLGVVLARKKRRS